MQDPVKPNAPIRPTGGEHPRRISTKERTVVNFPKGEAMPAILYSPQPLPTPPPTVCVITGKVARYKCPKTGQPRGAASF